MAELGPGLSDFNLTSNSDASTIKNQPGLDELLGNSILDEVSKAKLLNQEIEQRQAAEEPSLLDSLLSPKGLALLAGTLGVGLAGGGASGAAAFGLGAVQGTNAAVEAKKSANRSAIESLEGELEKSQERLDKARQRIATIFNTNPEAFLGPDGKPAVDERVLGWYATGTEIPLFPQTRRLLKERDERWTRRMNVLETALENAETKEDATNIVRAMMHQLQWFDADPATVDSLVNSIGTEEFDTTFASTLLRHGGSSGLDAMIFAGENGLPLHDPEVLRRVKFQSNADITPSQELNMRFIKALDMVNEFEQNPLNAEFVRETRANNSPEDARRIIAEQALGDIGSGEVSFYLDRVNAMNPEDFGRLFQAYSMVNSKVRLVDTVRGAKSLKDLLGMDEEEWQRYKMGQAEALKQEAEDTSRQSVVNQVAAIRNRTANTINQELKLGVQATYRLVDKITREAMRNAKKLDDGSIDRADFERLVSVYTREAIKQNSQ